MTDTLKGYCCAEIHLLCILYYVENSFTSIFHGKKSMFRYWSFTDMIARDLKRIGVISSSKSSPKKPFWADSFWWSEKRRDPCRLAWFLSFLWWLPMKTTFVRSLYCLPSSHSPRWWSVHCTLPIYHTYHAYIFCHGKAFKHLALSS